MKNLIQPIVILALLLALILVLSRECGHKPEIKIVSGKDVITVKIDTVKLAGKTVYKPIPYQTIDTAYVLRDVDTAFILRDWMKTRKYTVPIFADTNGNINLLVDVYQNQISKYQVDGYLTPHHTFVQHNTVIIEPSRNKVFIGFQLGAILPDKIITAPTVMLCTKQDHLYTIGYDPLNKVPLIGVLWKIRLSRRPP